MPGEEAQHEDGHQHEQQHAAERAVVHREPGLRSGERPSGEAQEVPSHVEGPQGVDDVVDAHVDRVSDPEVAELVPGGTELAAEIGGITHRVAEGIGDHARGVGVERRPELPREHRRQQHTDGRRCAPGSAHARNHERRHHEDRGQRMGQVRECGSPADEHGMATLTNVGVVQEDERGREHLGPREEHVREDEGIGRGEQSREQRRA